MSLWTRIVRMLTGEARASAARLTDPSASVDAAYRAQLELVADVRAQLVELITARKRLEMQIGTWERSGVRYAEVQALHDEIAALKAREEVVNGAVDEMRRRADALRAEREITRARVAAARAGITASSSIAGLTPQHDEIRAWLEQARSQTLDLEARAAALNELVARESGRTAISE